MSKAFLSYSRKDSAFVAELKKQLIAAHWDPWRDVDNLRARDRWPRKLGDAIVACDAFVLIWSADAASSEFVELEWTIAVAAKRQICIVALDQQRLPPTLSPYEALRTADVNTAVQWLAYRTNLEVADGDAAKSVLQQLGATTQAEPSQVTAGLRAAFLLSKWKINGPVYQSLRDIHVYLGEPRPTEERKTAYLTLIIAAVVVLLSMIALVVFYHDDTGVHSASVKERTSRSGPEGGVLQSFRGLVRDEQGQSLESVKVTAPKQGIATVTDAFGRFSFQVAPPADTKFLLVAEKPGYEVSTASPPAGDTSFNFVLRRKPTEQEQ